MGGKHSHRRKCEERVDSPWFPDDFPVLQRCSLKKWRKYRAVSWGFDPAINYSERTVRVQPAATGGRLLLASVVTPDVVASRLALYLEDEDCYPSLPSYLNDVMDKRRVLTVEDGLFMPKVLVDVPEQLKLRGLMHESYEEDEINRVLRRVNVIGCRDDHIVLQVVRASGANKIVLIREGRHTCSVISVFTVETEDDNPYLMEAIISSDYTHILLHPSWGFARNYRFTPEKDDVCLYDATDKRRQIPDPLVVFPEDGTLRTIAFDPRYGWMRIVCGTRYPLNGSDLLTVHDLSSGEQLMTSSPGRVQTTQNLVFSPDGRFLASLVASVQRKCSFQVIAVLIYDSEQLTVLKEVNCCSAMEAVGPMPFALFPLFSMNGRYMACFMMQEVESTVWADEMNMPMSVSTLALPVDLHLKSLCRLALRRWLTLGAVDELPLPTRLKDYLLFRPYA